MTDFARYLQTKMDEHGLSRSELARAVGVDRASITTYLNRGVTPKAETRERIAKALRVPADEVHSAVSEVPTHGVFELSPDRQADAQALDRSQSELIYEMIRHLAKANRQQRESDEEFEVDKSDRENVRQQELDEDDEYDLAASYGEPGVEPDELPGS